MTTSRPSMDENGQMLFCLPGESPVSRPPAPGSKEARQMTAGSGRKLCAYLAKCDPLGRFSRIVLESETWASTDCLLLWRRRDMNCPARRKDGPSYSIFQLVPLVSDMKGRGYGLWRTPQARDIKGVTQRCCKGRWNDSLMNMIKLWLVSHVPMASEGAYRIAMAAWLMGYTAHYLAPWETASSGRSRRKSSQPCSKRKNHP